MMIPITVSCTNNARKQEAAAETIEAEHINSNQIIAEPESTTDENRNGIINDNNLRIRSEPSTDAEILGKLNKDDYVTILKKTKERENVNKEWDYWYKIKTSENITGWVFGRYIYILQPNEPLEFTNNKWLRSFGELLPKENITLKDIQSCSWHTGVGVYLIFSKEGNYAFGSRWSGAEYGKYELHDNVISFNPAFTYFIASVKYQIDKLYYSNEMYYDGTPVLKNFDENLAIYPNNSTAPKLGETVRINRYYCEKIWEKTKLKTNNLLYALPDISSTNIFGNDSYYGNKSMEAGAVKLAKTIIDGVLWYYILLDFTIEPIDGGGPYFQGWLTEKYLE